MTTQVTREEHVKVDDPAGGRLFSPAIWGQLGHSLGLSARELQIVCQIFDNQKELTIATRLSISRHTVHTHIERLYHKLQVTSRAQLLVRIFAQYMSLTGQDGRKQHDP